MDWRTVAHHYPSRFRRQRTLRTIAQCYRVKQQLKQLELDKLRSLHRMLPVFASLALNPVLLESLLQLLRRHLLTKTKTFPLMHFKVAISILPPHLLAMWLFTDR